MANLTFLPSDISISQAIDIVIQQPRINDSNLTKKQIKETLESFHGDILASIVFLEKYALTDSNNKFYEWTLEQAKKRWAKAIHNIEKKYKNPIREKDFLKLYDYFLPAGRQMLGLGNNFIEKLTVNNCYFTAIKDDSLESIFDAAYKIAKTFSYSGGQGIDLGVLRPKEALVSNTAKTSTGAVSFAPMYSYITGLIGQRGRRGALLLSMPINHPDIEDFIDMKTKNIDDVRYANISVKITDEFMNAVENNQDFELSFKTKHEIIRKKINARKLFDKIVKAACNSGEPGILFWDACIRGSTSEIYDDLHVGGCNPCVTGDTFVYVADGRGHVSIKQLAEENKDIPVFCFDRKNKVKIRYMRSPRITGYNKPIWKITLDNNFEIRTTANHKFQLSNGEYKEVSELKRGDSLKRITKFEASINEIFGKESNSSTDYYWINAGFQSNIGEHRLIAGFSNNINLRGGSNLVVHHKDKNSKNNNPDNLEIMEKEKHDILHRQYMLGENNPMCRAIEEWSAEKWKEYKEKQAIHSRGENNKNYSGVSNEDILEYAIQLTKQINRRFSTKEWKQFAKEHNIPQQFSKWRNNHFNGAKGLSKIAALKCNIEYIDADPRQTKTIQRLTDQGYCCEIINNEVYVRKTCEICQEEFSIPQLRKEVGICSIECFAKKASNIQKELNCRQDIIENKREYRQRYKEQNANKLLQAYSDLKFQLQREPLLKELFSFCKENKIVHRFGPQAQFATYQDLKKAAENFNHKIIKIEFDGYENVYNGTVDEFHNYFIGGCEEKTKNGKNKWSYFNCLNCGEQILPSFSNCNLGSLLLHRFVKRPFTDKATFDFSLFNQMIALAVRHLDNVVDYNDGKNPLPEQNKNAIQERRIGLGVTGLADCLAALNLRYDSDEAISFINSLFNIKRLTEYNTSMLLASERGSFPAFKYPEHVQQRSLDWMSDGMKASIGKHGLRNIAISTIAPSGSLSVIANNCSSGIEPVYSHSYKRTVNLGTGKREFEVVHPGIIIAKKINKNFDIKKYYPTAYDIDWEKRVQIQGVIQLKTDSAISSTINLPVGTKEETVAEIYMAAWKNNLKGITVYVDQSREGVLNINKQKPLIEAPLDTKCFSFCAEGGDKFYVHVSYKESKPYQIFATNYKATEHDRFAKLANDIKLLLLEKGIPAELLKEKENTEKKIDKQCSRSKNSLDKITRLISLALKANYIDNLLGVLENHAIVGTLAFYLYHILLQNATLYKKSCKNCGSTNLKYENGCSTCIECGNSSCG